MFRNYVLPTILIAVAVLLFFAFTDSTYKKVQDIQTEVDQYDQALEKSRELIRIRDRLLSQYNNMQAENLERLKRMIPDHVDNVRLIIELDQMAAQYNMELEDIELGLSSNSESQNVEQATQRAQRNYDTRELAFSVRGSYENFLSFVADVERSSRLVDVSTLELGTGAEGSAYSMRITTYWLPQ